MSTTLDGADVRAVGVPGGDTDKRVRGVQPVGEVCVKECARVSMGNMLIVG